MDIQTAHNMSDVGTLRSRGLASDIKSNMLIQSFVNCYRQVLAGRAMSTTAIYTKCVMCEVSSNSLYRLRSAKRFLTDILITFSHHHTLDN